ncbi:MAG: hypothetical protein HYR91_00765 [Flavobacteriia bacterium]|nr:hypothetical protein [Flavobacteriia bacterium]
MKTFQYHYKALKIILEQFSKGKFIVYFFPSIFITLLYYGIQDILNRFITTSDNETINETTTVIISALKFIASQFYMFFILILLSPINATLSKKLDTSLTGSVHTSSFTEILNNILRMIFIFIIIIFFEFIILGLWWLLSFIISTAIPSFQLINPIIYYLVAAFFMGFSFYDYNLERYNQSTRRSLKFASNYLVSMSFTGAIFLLLKEIPYIGYIIAPIIATMIATIVYLYSIKKLPKKHNHRSPNKVNIEQKAK